MTPPNSDAGLTLIEVVVALALLAIIAAAGGSLVTTVFDADHHTAGRLNRLADIARAMALVGRDLTEIADAPLVGSSSGIAFARHRGWDGGAATVTRYRLTGRRLERVAAGSPQVLLGDVMAVRWRYYAVPGGWQDHWPVTGVGPAWPAAVAMDVDLAGPPPNGHLRRVVDLPVRPPPGTAPPGTPS